MKYCNNYIINPETIAILPEFQIEGAQSQIIEVDRIFFAAPTPTEIIEESLLHYGSDLKGARKSTAYHLGSVHRPPLMISSELSIYFYTSEAISKTDNVWFSVFHTKRMDKCRGGKTMVHFNNDLSLEVPVSYHSLNNNYLRGLHLKKIKDEVIQKRNCNHSVDHFYPIQPGEVQMVREGNGLTYSIRSKQGAY